MNTNYTNVVIIIFLLIPITVLSFFTYEQCRAPKSIEQALKFPNWELWTRHLNVDNKEKITELNPNVSRLKKTKSLRVWPNNITHLPSANYNNSAVNLKPRKFKST